MIRNLLCSAALISASAILVSCSSDPIMSSTAVASTASYSHSTSLYYALPRIKSQLQLKRKGDDDYSLQYVTDVPGPDPNYIFMIKYDASAFADDVVKVTTTADGLLSSIDVTNEDKTGAFLVQLAEVAKQAAKTYQLFDLPDAKQAAPEVLVADMLVDLTDANELTALNSYLRSKNTQIKVRVDGAQAPVNLNRETQRAECTKSICFRPKLAYVVTIDNEKRNTRAQQMLYSPNHAPLLSLDISRANFVKKITNVTFDKGMITSVSVTKPSEAVGLVSIPVEVLKTIVSIPAELVQLKIDTTNKDKNLADAQKQLIESQQQLLAARKKASDTSDGSVP